MLTKTKREIGNFAEELAVKFLESKGYLILERNFRADRGEIDVIAKKENNVVFVEVKSVRTNLFGEPENRINFKKQKQIGKVAQFYILQKNLLNVDFRFDVITVKIDKNGEKINHIENAFWL
jgi:putative endonuclease